MSDFFDDKPLDSTEEQVVEKIKIGEEEFDPEDLKEIVSKGKWAREVEEKQNTKLDRLMPEFTRTTQELKQIREERDQLKIQMEQQSSLKPQNELSEDEIIRQTKAQARKFGLLTVDDVDSYVSQKIANIQQANEMLAECKTLEGEYSGDDGRPKFDTSEVLEHMKETGIRNPLRAYKDKYEDQLDKWKESQLNAAKKKGIYTEEGSSRNHEPSTVKLTNANLGAALSEALYPERGE